LRWLPTSASASAPWIMRSMSAGRSTRTRRTPLRSRSWSETSSAPRARVEYADFGSVALMRLRPSRRPGPADDLRRRAAEDGVGVDPRVEDDPVGRGRIGQPPDEPRPERSGAAGVERAVAQVRPGRVLEEDVVARPVRDAARLDDPVEVERDAR